MPIASVNPATGETLRTFAEHDAAAVDAMLARAEAAQRAWRRRPVAERAAVVARAGALLDARKAELGRLMTLEMGKPIGAAVAEAEKCAAACRYYAEHADAFLHPETVVDERGEHGEVRFLPLGVVLAVMPWNFPFWQVVRFAAPALVAGNAGLLKHASNVPQCALALETIFRDAGAPDGVFQTLLIGAARVDDVLSDARVAAVTLTGSEPAGSAVGATAGRLIKKSVLELGGSDPFIVMPSADLARAVRTAVTARTINNGQSCIAAKRFIVHEQVADAFTRDLVAAMERLVVGDPLDPATQVGPLATPGIVEELDRQVRESVQAGARLLTGGRRHDGAGNFYPPTVLTDIPAGSPADRDETFGPVASVFRVPDLDAAIRVANSTTFGLGASAWTADPAETERFATELDAGSVFVNAMVASDPRFPFGGIKRSGYGRELGAYGLREFVNVKTVRVNRGGMAVAANSE